MKTGRGKRSTLTDDQIIGACERSYTIDQACRRLDCGRTWLDNTLNRLQDEGKIIRRSTRPICERRRLT
jgi:hypothetical protein